MSKNLKNPKKSDVGACCMLHGRFGRVWGGFGNSFGRVLNGFWKDFGRVLRGFWEVLGEFGAFVEH